MLSMIADFLQIAIGAVGAYVGVAQLRKSNGSSRQGGASGGKDEENASEDVDD